MRQLRTCSEDEMIATFLRGEYDSPRFSTAMHAALERFSLPARAVTHPNISSDVENRLRRRVLADYRGFGMDAELFHGFPASVRWRYVLLDQADLALVRYIDYDYWAQLSGGTRLVRDGAMRVRNNVEVFGVSNAPFFAVMRRLAAGDALAEPILVGATGHDDLVVLEGHVRLTAHLLLPPSQRPSHLRAIVGIALEFDAWPLY